MILNGKTLLIGSAILLSSGSLTSHAEIPDMDPAVQAIQTKQTAKPQRGMSMQSVLTKFGEPRVRIPAVGHPPISRWTYSDFEVFFEYDKVLHSVVPNNTP